jgi:hypothetical protein
VLVWLAPPLERTSKKAIGLRCIIHRGQHAWGDMTRVGFRPVLESALQAPLPSASAQVLASALPIPETNSR